MAEFPGKVRRRLTKPTFAIVQWVIIAAGHCEAFVNRVMHVQKLYLGK
jgi:hypothetical protein